jgi:hypothetical protein
MVTVFPEDVDDGISKLLTMRSGGGFKITFKVDF